MFGSTTNHDPGQSMHRSHSDTYAPSSIAQVISEHFASARTVPRSASNAEENIPAWGGNDLNAADALPVWAQELYSSRAGRQSRASSIISARTRLSNLTLDDARSIEITAGGQSFRINRDGSRVTDITAPPPYSPPTESLESDNQHMRGEDQAQNLVQDDVSSDDQTALALSTSNETVLDITSRDVATPTPARSDTPQRVLDIPDKLKRALGMKYAEGSQGQDSAPSSSAASMPYHPRRTQSDTSSYSWLRSWTKAAPETVNNEPANRRKSPVRNLNSIIDERSQEDDDVESLPVESMSRPHGVLSHDDILSSSTGTITNASRDSTLMDREDMRAAEISAHYNGLMRDLDRGYRKRLSEKDIEIAKLRQLLNEKDIIYRQALRDKDIAYDALKEQFNGREFFIKDLREKVVEMEETIESRLEKARNSVEDLWERRWKDYEKLIFERLGQGVRKPISASPAAASDDADEEQDRDQEP